MITIETEGNIVYSVAIEKLNDEDYNKLIPVLNHKIGAYETIRWYFEMRDFDGWSVSAAWRDIKFDFKNKEHLEKVAMVGAKKWEEAITQFMKLFTSTEIRFFELEEREEAQKWIRDEK